MRDTLRLLRGGQKAVEGFEERIVRTKQNRGKARAKRVDIPPLNDKQRAQVKQALDKTVEFEDRAAR